MKWVWPRLAHVVQRYVANQASFFPFFHSQEPTHGCRTGPIRLILRTPTTSQCVRCCLWDETPGLMVVGFSQVQGEFEHYYMAKRALAYYNDLLNAYPFEPSRYDIHSTEISRAGMSASAYSFGLVRILYSFSLRELPSCGSL